MTEKRIRAAILGASGYTGGDLIRLLAQHPDVDLVLLTGERNAGKAVAEVFPNLHNQSLPDFIGIDDVEWPAVELDVVFCALPHATSQAVIKGLMHATRHSLLEELVAEDRETLTSAIRNDVRIIDLSADFRLRDPEVYADWYGGVHQAAGLQHHAVYGLTEHYSDLIKDASLVACPGCYPTAALLGLLPLVRAGLVRTERIIIDAKSGVSGAGRGLKDSSLFCEAAESMAPYAVGRHRHMPEIEQELSAAANEDVIISFTPHLAPMNRGELLTIYLDCAAGQDIADLRAALDDSYRSAAFTHLLPEGVTPNTRMVRGSNHAVMNIFPDRQPGRVILSVAIDNLVKGSSGQAVQNMNLMFGLAETAGLEQVPLFP